MFDAPPLLSDEAQAITADAPAPWDSTLPQAPTKPKASKPLLSEIAAQAKQRTEAAKQAANAKAESDTEAETGEVVPFTAWAEVLKILIKKDPMLSGYLNRSKAYRHNKRILIDGGNMFRDFIRKNKDSQMLIKKILSDVTGEQYSIGPYEPQQVQSLPQASAEDTLRALQAKGLDITITDEKPKR